MHLHTLILGFVALIVGFVAVLHVYFEEKNEKEKDGHDFWNNSDNWGKH
ncbi:hypothetical protein UFOVP153_16 [uncultured Caudovirales phage]|uniref:Uncharacterized protein n=1 Tax=uncultured Caudovirales phage TaxID=2100421 RepID=A0A6J7W8D9_9CAUD|nr:hypothetical protein UFOVP69_42 [uncultured Caudovirales phage]CAB5170359.1 hypothetical protein UFOVP153_16 [uncultured Caudovirales phage]